MFKAFVILSLIGSSAFPSDVPFVDYLATPFNAGPSAHDPQADGISNSGLIVGSYDPYAGDSGGYFLYNSKSGSSTLFQFANGFNLDFILTGVNNYGTIIGYLDGTAQGYIVTPGALVPLTFPGSISTEPLAINGAGVVWEPTSTTKVRLTDLSIGPMKPSELWMLQVGKLSSMASTMLAKLLA